MFLPYTKFRLFRVIRKVMRTTAKPFRIAYDFFNSSVVLRWKNFGQARKFILTWMTVIFVLAIGVLFQYRSQVNSIKVARPEKGGRYIEAVVGDFSNVNPLFVVDGVNADVSKLIFGSLLEYGKNGKLVGDLAKSWKANKDADTFTVELKDNIQWHDGEPFTADDVAFTIRAIQQEETRSPHLDTWKGVDVDAVDDNTVVFKLPNSFAPFPALLRFGVVPEHLLSNLPYEGLRTSDFNDNPIGTGPFTFRSFREDGASLVLNQYENYHEGKPLINRIELRSYDTPKEAMVALETGNVDGYGGGVFDVGKTDTSNDIRLSKARTGAGSYVFFNSRKDIFNSQVVRQALTRGLNFGEIATAIETPLPVLDGPLSEDQLSLSDKYSQLDFNRKKAKEQLQKDGWKVSSEGVRKKDGKELTFSLSIPDTEINKAIAENIKKQWSELGANVQISPVPVEEFQINTVLTYNFDAALITLTNGLDPDVYVYWHSSGAKEGGLNFSGIKNDEIDSALEAGRTRVNPALRKAKYQSFVEQWRSEAPAVGLYQGLYSYVQRARVRGFDLNVLARPSDRFYNIETWSVLEKEVEPEELFNQ